MITNIRKAFIANIHTLSWMDKKTKDRVEDKVKTKTKFLHPVHIQMCVGHFKHPSFWRPNTDMSTKNQSKILVRKIATVVRDIDW